MQHKGHWATGRKPQGKRRAVSRCRLHADDPAMASGDGLGDRQSQSRAPLLTLLVLPALYARFGRWLLPAATAQP
jgi:hypothetical protein